MIGKSTNLCIFHKQTVGRTDQPNCVPGMLYSGQKGLGRNKYLFKNYCMIIFCQILLKNVIVTEPHRKGKNGKKFVIIDLSTIHFRSCTCY